MSPSARLLQSHQWKAFSYITFAIIFKTSTIYILDNLSKLSEHATNPAAAKMKNKYFNPFLSMHIILK